MPTKTAIERAKKDAREGKSPTTQAGEFVRETIDHVRKGKHGVRSAKQAIAIGLSEARRAGVELPPPKKGSAALKKKVKQDEERSKIRIKALKKEPTNTVSHTALSKQTKSAAKQRTASERSRAAKKAAKTR